MNPESLNYRHLLYFWAVAKEGTITRAASRLGLSVQTISTQLGLLERQLGQALFAPQGRSLVLTEAGRKALVYAEQIFHLGDSLRRALAESGTLRPRFAVGVTDAVPKLVAYHLLEAVLRPPLLLRLECLEGDFDNLLGELALNRLDLVLADRSAPERANLKLHSQLLGHASVDLFASQPLQQAYARDFPQSLNGAPILLPARGDPLRVAIDHWLEAHELNPVIVGEFTDSALLKTFGRAGLGLFPAPAGMREDIAAQFAAVPVGTLEGVSESWYAISTRRRVRHPAIAAIEDAGRAGVLSGRAVPARN